VVAVLGLKKFSKKQLHRAATGAFGYTVHDRSLHADRHRRSDYVTAFRLAGRLPFQYSQPWDTWHRVLRLPVNNRFPQNDYQFYLKNGFNTTNHNGEGFLRDKWPNQQCHHTILTYHSDQTALHCFILTFLLWLIWVVFSNSTMRSMNMNKWTHARWNYIF